MFSLRRFCASISRIALVLASVAGTANLFSAPAQAEGTFIPAAGRVDFVHDPGRDLIYISSGSQILRYRVSDSTFLTPLELGGSLRALDLSPDGNTLAVADAALTLHAFGPNEHGGRVVLVGLNTGSVRSQLFDLRTNEGGAYSLAYDWNGNLLISPESYPGTTPSYGPLRLLPHNSNVVIRMGGQDGSGSEELVAPRTVIVADTADAYLGLAENGSTSGDWGYYAAASGALTRFRGVSGTAGGNYPYDKIMGIASDPERFFLPTRRGTHVRTYSAGWITRMESTAATHDNSPASVAVDGGRRLAYIIRKGSSTLEVLNSATREPLATADTEESVGFPDVPYRVGHLRLDAQGGVLLLAQTNGVRMFRLSNGLPSREPSPTSLVTPEDTPKSFVLPTSFAPGTTLTYTLTTVPRYGTISGMAPNLTYNPRWNFFGSDSFVYSVTNGTTTETVSMSVTVTPVNDPPVAFNASYTFHRDKSRIIQLRTNAGDGQWSGPYYSMPPASIVTPPSHGTIEPYVGTSPTQDPNLFLYTPNAGFEGTDSFTFKTNDGEFDSNIATVSIRVIEPPVANDDTFAVPYTSSVTIPAPGIVANDTQAPNTSRYMHGASNVSVGTVTTRSDGSFTWNNIAGAGRPASGEVTFSYTFSDGWGTSNTANVTLSFFKQAKAEAQNVALDEDTSAAVTLAGEGEGALSYAITTPPAHGTLSGEAPNLTYTPREHFNGTDSFVFRVTDAMGASASATVSLTVRPVEDPVTLSVGSAQVDEDDSVTFALPVSDPDGRATISTSAPGNGVLSGQHPNVSYRPNANWNGTDSFFVTVVSGDQTQVAPFSINVRSINDTPTAQNASFALDQGTSKSFVLNASDADGEPLSYAITTPPQNGSLSGTAPNLTYTPNAGFHGSDTFKFSVTDPVGATATAQISLSVNRINRAPITQPLEVKLDEDGTQAFVVPVSDPDGDALSLVWMQNPPNGSITGTFPNLVYTPHANWNGTDTLKFRVRDASGAAVEGAVQFVVAPVNDAPVVKPMVHTISEDGMFGGSLGFWIFDVDGDLLQPSIKRHPDFGTLSVREAKPGIYAGFTYNSPAEWSGIDTFELWISDGTVQVPMEATLTVEAVNDPPVVAPAYAWMWEDETPVAVTLTGTDAENAPLTFRVVSPPSHGTLSGEAPNLIYTPHLNWHGEDFFSWVANDGNSDSRVVTFRVGVLARNDAPTALAQAASTNEDTPVAVTLAGSDVEGDSLTFHIVSGPRNGTLSGTAPNLTYTPTANFFGSDALTFKVRDTSGLESAPATVSFTVTPINDAPTFALAASSVSVKRNSGTQTRSGFATQISTGNSFESAQSLAFTISNSDPSLFELQPSLSSNGTLSFKPARGKRGNATVSVTLKDNGGTANGGRDTSATRTFTISVK